MKKIASPFRLTDTVTLRNRLTSGGGQQACTQGPEEFPTDNAIDEAISVASASASIVCFTHYGIFGRGAATGSQEGIYPTLSKIRSGQTCGNFLSAKHRSIDDTRNELL